MSHRKSVLVISQVYLPDPAAVGMQMADAAAELSSRGYQVTVLTANRGYDDPSQKFPTRETMNGVLVIRLPFSSFGKGSMLTRLVSGLLFVIQASIRGIFLRRVDGILVSTSPPMCSLAALVLGKLRKAPIAYWVMDLNPDQAVVLGRIKPTSIVVSAFERLNRMILSNAKLVVALDRFMAERLNNKLDVQNKIEVLPPWPHDNHLQTVEHSDNPFRVEHQLQDKFVVMYSGNHGPSSPVTTCLEAARRLTERKDIVFLFVGGGVGKMEVEQAIANGATNVRSLPYQPLEAIKYSLSAADLHLVTVGDLIVGVVHPSKIYGAMSIGRPVLLTAPKECHAAPLVSEGTGYHVANGDAVEAARAIETVASLGDGERRTMGQRAKQLIADSFSRRKLRSAFVDLVVQRLEL